MFRWNETFAHRGHWTVVHFDLPILSNTEKELFFESYSSRLNVVSTKNDTKSSENKSLGETINLRSLRNENHSFGMKCLGWVGFGA